MTSGYDEWAVARMPALLRFAQAVLGPTDGADKAVATALARVASSWDSVVRSGHPDLTVRRFVVDAIPSRRTVTAPAQVSVPSGGGAAAPRPDAEATAACLDAMPVRRRAAIVLRHLEGLSDPEITDVLRSSNAALRGQLQRAEAALALAAPASSDAWRDVLHAVLAERAAAAPEQIATPLPTPRARRRLPALRATAVAAAAVLALVGTVTLINHLTQTPPGEIRYPAVAIPSDWRFESYDGVQVRVPPTWGWGGAPMRSDFFGARKLGSCGANQAAVSSTTDGTPYVSSATPFVGRPAMLTDRCVPWGSDGVMPSTDAVWFGSPLPVGVKAVGSVLAETRAVGDQHVTVFAAEADLRRQILSTAQLVEVDGNGCPTHAVQQPVAGTASLDPASLSVCAYSQDTGVPVLLWSGRAGAGAASAYLDAFSSPTAGAGEACTATPNGQWVAIGLNDSAGTSTRWDIANLGCGRLTSAGGAEAAMLPATVAPWALPGVKAYVAAPAPATADLAPYFRQLTGVGRPTY